MRFRKKPVEIEAHRWFKNGDHPDDYAGDEDGHENGKLRVFTGAERKEKGWEGSVVRYFRHPDVPGDKPCEQCGLPHHVHGWVDTLEQGHRVCPGDWIVTGVKGERYPVKPDIFDATYEPVVEAGRFRRPDGTTVEAVRCEGVKAGVGMSFAGERPDWLTRMILESRVPKHKRGDWLIRDAAGEVAVVEADTIATYEAL